MSEETERLLDKIERLEKENAELRDKLAEHPGQPVGWGNEAEDEFNAQ